MVALAGVAGLVRMGSDFMLGMLEALAASAQMAALETRDIAVLTTDQLAALTTAQIAALTTSQLKALTTLQVQSLTTESLSAITTARISALTTAQIVALTTDQMAGLATSRIVALATEQVAALETEDLAALSTTQARAFVTVLGGGNAEACSLAAITGKTGPRFIDVCTKAIEDEQLSPRDRASTYINRGVLKIRVKDWAAAGKDFDMAVQIKPNRGDAYVNRGAASLGQHRFADSIADLSKGIELGSEEPAKAYYNRALAYEGLDDMKAAYFDYMKAAELSPDWAAPKNELVRFTVSPKE